MLGKILNIGTHHKVIVAKLETIILLGLNGMSIGMIDWVRGISSILESTPAILLTITMVLLNLAKAYQIYIDTLIKKKKLEEENHEE